jgi:glycosyltransferase involved in cell wall biosynthesis
MPNPHLSIIIPAHNEERRLPDTLEQVVRFIEPLPYESEVLVVENASSDKTLEIARGFEARHPFIRALHENLPGKGRAVQTGMLVARGAYRFFADADLSMPIGEVNRFLPPAVEAPIVIASREAPGAIRYDEPAYRHITGRVFNGLIRALVLPGLQDTQCGFKMFRADVAEDLFKRQTLMGWSFDVELLYIAGLRGLQVVEIPIPWYFNPESKVNVLRDSWRMFRDLLLIRRNGRLGKYA